MTGRIPHRGRSLAIALGTAAALALAALAMYAAQAVAKPTCAGRKATVVRGAGNDVIKASKHGVQVIVAGAGNDVIIAQRNKDIVCAGDGDDYVNGGTGRDKLYGELGNDTIDEGPGTGKAFGGPGDDTLLGGGGGDSLQGDDGSDRIYGQIQDDHLNGGTGNDLVVGGHGIDDIQGGPGDDWIRGDVNTDTFLGDDGNDTLSFATATPPGANDKFNGVSANLRTGNAVGDDGFERLSGIENVVGSAFDDELTGAGGGLVRGNGGKDSCTGFSNTATASASATACAPNKPTSLTAYIADPNSLDPGLIVLGGSGNDTLSVDVAGSRIAVTGSQMTAGPGCTAAGGAVSCALPPTPLGYILLWGDAGNDVLSVGSNIPVTTAVTADGGPGNDQVTGGPGSDILYAGESGSDHLSGQDGDDALVGRPGGPDILDGGPGNDNLVSNNPCDGHTYIGGPGGADAASFGHVTIGGVQARLNGTATLRGGGACNPTQIQSSEVLEGSIGNDLLVGTRHDDLLVGREGDDVLIGRGGHDDFRGDDGGDRCIGRGAKSSC